MHPSDYDRSISENLAFFVMFTANFLHTEFEQKAGLMKRCLAMFHAFCDEIRSDSLFIQEAVISL